jgi:hypothetical protein
LTRKEFLERVRLGSSSDATWSRRVQWWADEGLLETNPAHDGAHRRPKVPVYAADDVPLVAALFPVADCAGQAAMIYARAIKIWLRDDVVFAAAWRTAQVIRFSPSLALRLTAPPRAGQDFRAATRHELRDPRLPLPRYRFDFSGAPDPWPDVVGWWELNLTRSFFEMSGGNRLAKDCLPQNRV